MIHDEISNPKHYSLFPDGIQAIDVIEAALTPEEFAGYLKGNFLKYRLRAGEKGPAEKCIGKAEWYRERLHEHHDFMNSEAITRAEHAKLKADAVGQAAAFQSEAPTLLPDGSAFAVMSFPLPGDHWLYVTRRYVGDAVEPDDLPRPILNHGEHREAVTAAVRYAVRAATNCGAEPDFDPDALVQAAVYALCGPYNRVASMQDRPDETRRQDAAAEDEAFAAIKAYTGRGGAMICCPGCVALSCECRP